MKRRDMKTGVLYADVMGRPMVVLDARRGYRTNQWDDLLYNGKHVLTAEFREYSVGHDKRLIELTREIEVPEVGPLRVRDLNVPRELKVNATPSARIIGTLKAVRAELTLRAEAEERHAREAERLRGELREREAHIRRELRELLGHDTQVTLGGRGRATLEADDLAALILRARTGSHS